MKRMGGQARDIGECRFSAGGSAALAMQAHVDAGAVMLVEVAIMKVQRDRIEVTLPTAAADRLDMQLAQDNSLQSTFRLDFLSSSDVTSQRQLEAIDSLGDEIRYRDRSRRHVVRSPRQCLGACEEHNQHTLRTSARHPPLTTPDAHLAVFLGVQRRVRRIITGDRIASSLASKKTPWCKSEEWMSYASAAMRVCPLACPTWPACLLCLRRRNAWSIQTKLGALATGGGERRLECIADAGNTQRLDPHRVALAGSSRHGQDEHSHCSHQGAALLLRLHCLLLLHPCSLLVSCSLLTLLSLSGDTLLPDRCNMSDLCQCSRFV